MRDYISELLSDGVPLRAICRTLGMPSRRTVYRWRSDDPAFERQYCWVQQEGYVFLAARVVDEVEAAIGKSGVAAARLIFNMHKQQLARQVPGYFGNRGLRQSSVQPNSEQQKRMAWIFRAACARSHSSHI